MTAETYLVTDLEKLGVRTDRAAIGGIWLEVGGAAFPEVGWSDFIVVVLAWLSAAILDVLRHQASARRVHFMDGPYAVDISMAASGQLQFRTLASAGGGHGWWS